MNWTCWIDKMVLVFHFFNEKKKERKSEQFLLFVSLLFSLSLPASFSLPLLNPPALPQIKTSSHRKRHQRQPDVVGRRPHPPNDPRPEAGRGERADLDGHPEGELREVRERARHGHPEVLGRGGGVADEGEASEGPEEDSCRRVCVCVCV